MKRPTDLWIAIAGCVAFLAIGIPYWIVPYRDAQLPSAIVFPGLVGIAIGAFLVRSMKGAPLMRTIVGVGASAPAAVAVRVFVEIILDPTSHNLWPFEIVIAAATGFACAAAGGLLGGFVFKKT